MSWHLTGSIVVVLICAAAFVVPCAVAFRALWRHPASFLAAFAALAIGATIQAQKTNGVNNLPPAPLMLMSPPAVSSVSVEDIARGWRIEGVTTNAAVSYAMPTNAMLVGNWHVHGASSSFGNNRADFDGWAFPLGTNGAAFSAFWYFVDGRIRPAPRDAAREICSVGAPMSAVPGQSRLWTAEEPDGARVITWDNFFLGGDTNCPVNAQIRLFVNGDFTTRSNEVETVCRRVNPDDWDGDGIANDVDLSPLVCDGDFFGPSNILPEGANTNAYCSVSLVATGPDALITFEGDGPSNYPDPYFVAKSGETNEVVILIGKTYAISSDWPFDVVGVSDPETEEWTVRGTAHQTSVCRPVAITSSGGNPFTMSIAPANIGGAFAWQPTTCSCSLSGSGTTFSWNCPTDCTCCGCAAEGLYSYEGYGLPATSCLCGCHYDGTGPTWGPSPAPLAASVSATFSKSAVIFEDAYENEPGKWGVRNPTRTRLNVVANGGPNGATLSVASSNLAKLTRLSGPDLPLASVTVSAETQVSYSIVYEGNEASVTADDITVTAIVTDADTGAVSTNECAATSIRLELTPVWEAPENPCTNRHVFGVGEKVLFKVRPQLSSVVLSTTKYDTGDYEDSAYECFGTNVLADASIDRIYTCPISANYHPPIKVTFGTVEYLPTISLVEPEEVITTGTAHGFNKVDIFHEEWLRCWPRGSVGTATLVTTNYIGPMTVSFRGIAVSEIPCEEEDIVTGCFTNGHARTHTFAVGAGRAYPIKDENFWFVDGAGIGRVESNWIPNSEMVWKSPVGWHRRGASDDWFGVPRPDYEVRNRFSSRSLVLGLLYRQRFSIDEDGVFKIEKYGHWISRSRFCRVVLDGKTVQENHP